MRSGPERTNRARDDVFYGVPVAVASGTTVRVGDWPSGLYFASLQAPNGLVGYAPFIVRPRVLGEHRVAVVLPTNTWQAYNFRDENRDGVPDSWYADPHRDHVDLARPYLNRGVPPHFRGYDLGFIRWLARRSKQVDVLSDDDLDAIASATRLAGLYDLVVFSGHEEYVTKHMVDLVHGFRDRGGNLAFLSANNFFYRVQRRGHELYRTGRWRDLGRPEAGFIGVQYLDWNEDKWGNKPFVVTGSAKAPWFFAGTGLRDGDRFGVYGIEIDARTPQSPTGVRVLARIPDAFGPGRSAEMTYYTTPRGAKVFAAGAINFGGSALWPVTSRLLENLWTELSAP
jgi:hypothetical protein